MLIQTNEDGGVKNLGLEAWYLWNWVWMVDRLIFWKGGRLENFSGDCRGIIWDIHIFCVEDCRRLSHRKMEWFLHSGDFFFANGLPRYSSPFNSPVPNIFFRKSILNKQIKVLCCSFSTKAILRGCEKKTPTIFFVDFGWPKKGKIYEFQFSKSYLLDPDLDTHPMKNRECFTEPTRHFRGVSEAYEQ